MHSIRLCHRRTWGSAGLAVLAMVCASITGCSTISTLPPANASLAPRALVTNFAASGRIAARVAGETRRGFSGGFNWTHDPAGDTIELLTPVGQIAARMTVTAAGAAVELADGRRTFAADPEQFLAEMTGVSLPIAALPHWMQAVPMSTSPFRAEADALGRPSALWQNGWQIQYTAYADETAGANPTRLQLNMGDIDARLVISEWTPQ
ncbi:MAG: lipoprotein insertase outer membrane protein LolB [Betaproteobacteria bacterium]